jgi:hypothetical protein
VWWIAEITACDGALDAFFSGKAPVIVLAELARITGDDTHFTRFRFDGGGIDGFTASAASLAQAVETARRDDRCGARCLPA